MERPAAIDLIAWPTAPLISLRSALSAAGRHVRYFSDVEHYLPTALDAPGLCAVGLLENSPTLGPTVGSTPLELPLRLRQRGLLTPVIYLGSSSWAARCWAAGAARLHPWPADLRAAARRLLATAERYERLASLTRELPERLRAFERLTGREREVFDRLAEGWNVQRIADHFGTSPNTVRSQRTQIVEKLEVRNVLEAVSLREAARWFAAVRDMVTTDGDFR